MRQRALAQQAHPAGAAAPPAAAPVDRHRVARAAGAAPIVAVGLGGGTREGPVPGGARDGLPGAVIVNAPGSTGGVRDAVAVLGPLVGHLLDQLDGGDH